MDPESGICVVSDGVFEFAQKFISDGGKRNGLYWEAAEDEIKGPLGPLLARAAEETYMTEKQGEEPTPHHGDFFRVLKA